MRLSGIIFLILLVTVPCLAQDAFPYKAHLKNSVTNVRTGPGKDYPIVWVYNRQNWPVHVLYEHHNWYRIRDIEGEEGWIYHTLVRSGESALVSEGDPLVVYRSARQNRPLLRLAPAVIVRVKECTELLCLIEYGQHKGWVTATRLWRIQGNT